jgi:hypothetical protein
VPGIDRESVEGSGVRLVWVAFRLGLVRQVPEMIHENAADRMDGVVSIKAAMADAGTD